MKSETSKFSTQRHCEELVWQMRLADFPRSASRDILNRTYNGDPPYDPVFAEENGIEFNRNFLEGTGVLTDARTQWNTNFLGPGNILTVQLDSGPAKDKAKWSQIITKHLNRALKRSPEMMSNIRETGAAVLLHGIGPSTWSDRRSPIPKCIPISSLMIPSETDVDFSNLEYFAIFREMTFSQLWDKTHGTKVDPGWNMPLVMQELKFIAEQVFKQTNMSNFQYSPERMTELLKQDHGFWGSDAVPTIDYWDFYYLKKDCWYRKIFLDWSSGGRECDKSSSECPKSPSGEQFLYDSGKRKYADGWNQVIHANFGDCSCVAPFKYHSVRSLGWMNWGIVNLADRLNNKVAEQAFSDLMWFFRTASQGDLNRIKKADFINFGVIPQGIDWVRGNERFSPDPKYIQFTSEMLRSKLQANSTSFTRSAERSSLEKEKTATQVMAEVNSANTMTSGVMNLAKVYETPKYREIGRRFCIANNPDKMVSKFRKAVLGEGVPPEYLDIEKWDIEAERTMGAGNKTVQMAIVQYLNSIRQNLGPEAQRQVDHDGILIMTEDAAKAELLAPIKGQPTVSKSGHDAELATERLMAGLPFSPTPHMIYEEYVLTWLRDMGLIIMQIQRTDNMGTREQIMGLQNIAKTISVRYSTDPSRTPPGFLDIMAQDEANGPKVREYGEQLAQMMNVVKGFAQRLAEQQQAGNGSEANGELAMKQAELQSKRMVDQAKIQNSAEKAAQSQAQKQAGFELQQQREDRKMEADIRRANTIEILQTQADIRKQGREALEQQNTPDGSE